MSTFARRHGLGLAMLSALACCMSSAHAQTLDTVTRPVGSPTISNPVAPEGRTTSPALYGGGGAVSGVPARPIPIRDFVNQRRPLPAPTGPVTGPTIFLAGGTRLPLVGPIVLPLGGVAPPTLAPVTTRAPKQPDMPYTPPGGPAPAM